MKTLFGKAPKQVAPQASQGGFNALPEDIQNRFRGLLGRLNPILDDPSQYFAPMGLTEQEQSAAGLINLYQDPKAYQRQIETFMSPYRNIVTEDINRSFEDPYSALKSRATEAGAFGDSRYRSGEADLEEARLRAIAAAMQGQYGQAQNQMQGTIGNLLGFGDLQRSIDLSQRGALPQAIGFASGIYNPLLSSQTGGTASYTRSGEEGLIGKAGKIASLAGSIGGFFSDRRLKKNIKRLGEKKGLNLYEFEYLWSPQKFIGYMADEVEVLYPDAIGQSMGYKTVNYGAI